MKNDINIIKNELIEEYNEKKLKRQQQKEKQLKKDFAELCKGLIITSIYNSIENGATLQDIYKKRTLIINSILQDIKNKYIIVDDLNKWDADAKKEVRMYPYPDYIIIDLLNNLFDSEFLKEEKRQKKEQSLLKEALQKHLAENIRYYIKKRDSDLTANDIIKGMETSEGKNIIVEEIADNENELNLLNSIYYKTLNEIKKEYKHEPESPTSNIKLALPWRIIAFYKGISKLWKL